MEQLVSPTIQEASWGEIHIEGFDRPFRDAKVYPGGACEWDWRETGTHHAPGIQPDDVRGLLEYNPSVMIFSKGFWQRLQVKHETQQLIVDRGIDLHILETSKAVERYNQSTGEQLVAGLFHSTC